MCKLVLNAGGYVLNIEKGSDNYLCYGVVTLAEGVIYCVEYNCGNKQYYHKEAAHYFLEKIINESNQCKVK